MILLIIKLDKYCKVYNTLLPCKILNMFVKSKYEFKGIFMFKKVRVRTNIKDAFQ